VAVAVAEGPARGLALLEEIGRTGALDHYLHFHSARADLLRRLKRWEEARIAYQHALALAGNASERKFLKKRLEVLAAG